MIKEDAVEKARNRILKLLRDADPTSRMRQWDAVNHVLNHMAGRIWENFSGSWSEEKATFSKGKPSDGVLVDLLAVIRYKAKFQIWSRRAPAALALKIQLSEIIPMPE